MTDQTGRPDDENRPDDSTPRPEQPQARDEASPESVLTGFSWDDPSGAAPRRAEDGPQEGTSDAQAQAHPGDGDWSSHGSSAAGTSPDAEPSYAAPPAYGAAPETPAQYPPAAPYPPAAGPYGQAPAQPGTGAPADPYGQGGQPYAPPGTDPQGGGQVYGQQAAPYAAGGGYGQSAQYTSTPQPYAYGPPPLTPEAESVRSKAILWTILNSVSLVLGLFVLVFNIPSLVGLILSAMAIGRTRTDLDSARGLVRWSWILFVIGLVLGLIWWIVIFAFFASAAFGTAGMMGGF